MSSEGSSPTGKINTRYSTPAPELDDHRIRLGGKSSPLATRLSRQASPVIPAGNNLNIPALELHAATPSSSISGAAELLRVDEALRNQDRSPVARDFEHAIDDESGDETDGKHGRHVRRDTRRGGRPREIRQDRSRDTSSSRSTSPANSIEAFAEPRRRQRANTIDSHASIADFQRQRFGSVSAGTRRPTLTDISAPKAPTRGTAESILNDINTAVDEEAGKTYKIDFEELDEFVALCSKGLIPGQTTLPNDDEVSKPKVFADLRQESTHDNIINNVALNPDTFFEKPVAPVHSAPTAASDETCAEKLVRPQTKTSVRAPERFTFFSSEIQSAKYANQLGGLLSEDESFRDLFDIGLDGGVWWLDIQNPTRAELEVIARAFKIHRLTREDIETQESREKVELFSQYYFVSFRTFNPDKASEDFLDPLHIYIVVTGDGVLSFSYLPNPHAKNVRRRIAKLGDFVSLGPDYICYAMIDDIVDSFAPIIHEAENASEAIEDQVFIAREDDFLALLKSIGECRKRVLNMMRLLGGKADVIKGFAKRCNEQYDVTPRGDIGLYLGDIQDHVVTMMSNLGHVEKMLSRSHANYLAQLNVDNILKGNDTNKALAKITVVATVIVPLNLVTGIFGMNVHVPGQDVPGYAWFGGIMGVIVLFICVSVTTARKLHYI